MNMKKTIILLGLLLVMNYTAFADDSAESVPCVAL